MWTHLIAGRDGKYAGWCGTRGPGLRTSSVSTHPLLDEYITLEKLYSNHLFFFVDPRFPSLQVYLCSYLRCPLYSGAAVAQCVWYMEFSQKCFFDCLFFSFFSLRKRHREERIASTSLKVQQMKQRLTNSERKRENWLYWRPILLNVGAGAALAVGLLLCWMYSQWNTLSHLKLTLIFAPVPGLRYLFK